jgi:hypothetical protein
MMAKIALNAGRVIAGLATNKVRIGADRDENSGESQAEKNVPTLRAGTIEDHRAIVIVPIGRPARIYDMAKIAEVRIRIGRLSVRCRRSP